MSRATRELAAARRAELEKIQPITDLRVGIDWQWDQARGEYVFRLMVGVDAGADLTSLAPGPVPHRLHAIPVIEICRLPHRVLAEQIRAITTAAAPAPPPPEHTA